MSPKSILIVGAHRGLGSALVKRYADMIGSSGEIFATVEKPTEQHFPKNVKIIEEVDCTREDCADKVIAGLQGKTVELAIYVSGAVKAEEFGSVNWNDEIEQYKICSVAPVLIVERLVTSSALSPAARIALLTSEAGCITLRTESEGGSSYGHHGAKAAGNMVGHLLSYNLREKGHPIVMINPGMLKTDMTKSMGLQDMYRELGALTPEEAAVPLSKFLNEVDMSMTGKLWAPNGAHGIGGAEEAMGKEWASRSGPLELPW